MFESAYIAYRHARQRDMERVQEGQDEYFFSQFCRRLNGNFIMA